MKKIKSSLIGVLSFLILSICTLQAEEAKPMTIFLLSGQSNMGGRGSINKLDDESKSLLKSENVWLFADHEGDPFVCKWKPKRIWESDPNTSRWIPFEIKNVNFGPELTFVAEMKKKLPDTPIGIIKFAPGGTGLNQHWFGRHYLFGGRSIYPEFIEAVKTALIDKKDAVIAGMIWMQGESDTSDEDAAQYAAHFSNLVTGVRQELNAPEMKFVCGRINSPVKGKATQNGIDTVRKVQTDCSLPNTAWVDCDDLPKNGDNVHYSEEGLLELGRRFAEKMGAMKE